MNGRQKYLKYASPLKITVFSNLILGTLVDGYQYFWETCLEDGDSTFLWNIHNQ